MRTDATTANNHVAHHAQRADGAAYRPNTHNRLWELLSDTDDGSWPENATLVELERGQTLLDGRRATVYVYFPTTAMVSLLASTSAGKSAELAMVGNDGMVGVEVVFGAATPLQQAVVTSPGMAWRIRTEVLAAHLPHGSCGCRQLLRYAHLSMTEVSQTALCNLHHSVRQRLCRSLAQAVSRGPSRDLWTTQEAIGLQLGVRRESVTGALRKLADEGLIECSRGRLRVLKQEELESESCECFGLLRAEWDQFFDRTPLNVPSSARWAHRFEQQPSFEGGRPCADAHRVARFSSQMPVASRLLSQGR